MIIANMIKGIANDQDGEQYGCSEQLEILGAIIQGLSVPLKEEHKKIYESFFGIHLHFQSPNKHLGGSLKGQVSQIPVHKSRFLQTFHQQLSQCVVYYLEKDESVGDKFILSMLKYWPVVNPSKEIMFLNELEEIIDCCSYETLVPVRIKIV